MGINEEVPQKVENRVINRKENGVPADVFSTESGRMDRHARATFGRTNANV